MKKGEEEKEIQEIIEEPTETPTPEEQLAKLQADFNRTAEELVQTKKGLSTAHQTLTQRDQELKRIKGQQEQLDALSAKLEVLGGLVLQQQGEEADLEGLPPTKKVDLSQRFKEASSTARMESQMRQRQERAEATGLPMDDQRILTVEYLTTHGRFGEADKLLEQIEAEATKPEEKKEVKETKPTETEEERIERLAEEKYRAKLEEEGRLTTEVVAPSAPSGGVFTRAQIEAMSPQEVKKTFGNWEGFVKAVQEGKIKE